MPPKCLVFVLLLLTVVHFEKVGSQKKSSKMKLLMEQQLVEEKEQKLKQEKENQLKAEREEAKSKGGFFIGRILPNGFELEELNKDNWMRPDDAVKICESDLRCAGFTYRGSITVKDLPTNIYFFKHFPKSNLDLSNKYSCLYWTSYRVKRPYVVLQGKPLIYREIVAHSDDAVSIRFKKIINDKDISAMADLAWPFIEGSAAMVFNALNDEIYTNLQVYNLDEHNSLETDYLTVLNSHDPDGAENIQGNGDSTLDNCCPDEMESINIDLFFNEETDETIETVSCKEMTKEKFEQNYVRKRKAVKLVECLDEETISEWTLENIFSRYESKSDLKGSFWKNNKTIQQFVIPSERAKKMLEESTLVNIESGIPLKMGPFYNLKNVPIPDNIRELADSFTSEPSMRIQSKGTGSLPTIEAKFECSISTLMSGNKWWAIFPADSLPKLSNYHCVENYCSGQNTYRNSILAPQSWFSHMLSQVVRKTFYGQKVVQTIQRPGEIIYIPGNSPYAYYNFKDTSIDVVEKLLTLANIEVLHPEDDPDYKIIKDKIANADEKRKMTGIEEHIQEAYNQKIFAPIMVNGI